MYVFIDNLFIAYLFIVYSLFNNGVSNSEHMASNNSKIGK
jgi:hypothetical protein